MGIHKRRPKFDREHKQHKMSGNFSSGLFACFSDPGTCCLSWCGLPFIVGKNAEAIGEDATLWALSSWSPVPNSLLRSQIRKKNGIEGRYAVDLLIHCCCPCCAVSQEARHLKSCEKLLDDDDINKAKKTMKTETREEK